MQLERHQDACHIEMVYLKFRRILSPLSPTRKYNVVSLASEQASMQSPTLHTTRKLSPSLPDESQTHSNRTTSYVSLFHLKPRAFSAIKDIVELMLVIFQELTERKNDRQSLQIDDFTKVILSSFWRDMIPKRELKMTNNINQFCNVVTEKQGTICAVNEWEQEEPTISLEEDASMEEYDPLFISYHCPLYPGGRRWTPDCPLHCKMQGDDMVLDRDRPGD
ncbi:unnamed protein product [Mytilus coruscus]|uniref:Uncharacterized protein n=1 Tax=Mytilus coruscus TaxID=42192 RepID=A0A6J8DE89_MYTCO|nr:unnamed protein product [Mytilus coruscus]